MLVLAAGPRGRRSGDEDRDLLDAFARQGALALARSRLLEQAKAAALRARTEELRSSLLSAVSHDLRTPLAAITGAASALRDEAAGADAERARASCSTRSPRRPTGSNACSRTCST